jgi:UDP-N-acetylglucosamine 2-epimerase
MKYNKLKVVTVVGTRPELIRLSRIIFKMDSFFNHILIHTGQNYTDQLNKIFFTDLGIREPNYSLDIKSNSSINNIASIFKKLDDILDKEKPDCFFIIGDTDSALSSIVAKKKKIPIFHYEAGNRCFDNRVPEEINRKIIDSIADINLTYSEISRQNLIREGAQADRVINLGSPLFEVIQFYKKKINKSKILNVLKIKNKNFLLFSVHRQENVDNKINFGKIINIINYLANNYKYKIVFSVHPRIEEKIQKIKYSFNKKVILSKPFNFSDYNKLQISSNFVISDSGSINEEAAILKFNAINFRETHERLESNNEAITIMTGLNLEKVIQSIEFFGKINNIEKSNKILVSDYTKFNISDKIIKIILSYVNYINRNIYKLND